MAFHDNRLWLLSHIHNSFISSDDTGICEMVMAPENFKEEMTMVAKTQVHFSNVMDIMIQTYHICRVCKASSLMYWLDRKKWTPSGPIHLT